MVAFVDAHGDKYGVEPICKVLPIAPSTYYEHKARQADPWTCAMRPCASCTGKSKRTRRTSARPLVVLPRLRGNVSGQRGE